MTERDREALQHCELGLQHMWKGEVGAALAAYDRAATLPVSEETRELITIRKARGADRGGSRGAGGLRAARASSCAAARTGTSTWPRRC